VLFTLGAAIGQMGLEGGELVAVKRPSGIGTYRQILAKHELPSNA